MFEQGSCDKRKYIVLNKCLNHFLRQSLWINYESAAKIMAKKAFINKNNKNWMIESKLKIQKENKNVVSMNNFFLFLTFYLR